MCGCGGLSVLTNKMGESSLVLVNYWRVSLEMSMAGTGWRVPDATFEVFATASDEYGVSYDWRVVFFDATSGLSADLQINLRVYSVYAVDSVLSNIAGSGRATAFHRGREYRLRPVT